MTLGEINKGAVALLVALVLGAGGYLWYSFMYKPAVAEQTTAKTAADTAAQDLAAAQAELRAAQERIEQSKKDAGKLDDSVSKVALSRMAIPADPLIDDAAVVLTKLADRSGVNTSFSAGTGENSGGAATGGGLSGATPIDIEFEAAGSYSEMMNFIDQVENTVAAKRGKLHTRGRLFNVVSLEIGAPDDDESSGGDFGDSFGESEGGQESALVVRKGDVRFTVVVRMYTSSSENAEGVGAATPDPAAQGTDPAGAAGADATGGASATGGAPAGAATDTSGAATGGATNSTTPSGPAGDL